MKYADMDERQKRAYRNIYHASNWLLGGLENGVCDGDIEAENILQDHEALVEMLYEMAIRNLYGEGSVLSGAQIEMYLKDIRFCGKEWLMERCEKRITKEGY